MSTSRSGRRRRAAATAAAVMGATLGATAPCRPAAAAEQTSFVDAALAHGGFKAFVALVSRAGLVDTLGASPVTVFMPTDGAFSRLSAAQRKSIADLSPEGVRDFVGRFVFPGTAMASNDVDKTVTSENGTAFDVTWYVGRLSLRDHRGPATGRLAYVVEGDIPAGPGVIDAVDTVLMPATFGPKAVPAAAAVPEPTTPAAASAAPATAAPPAPASKASPTPSRVPVAAAPAGAPATSSAAANPETPAETPSAPAPVAPPVRAPVASAPVPEKPELSVAATGLRTWPLKIGGNGSTGKVNGVMIGLPDGRVTGLSVHFGGFLGLGGRSVYVPWDRVTPDAKAHVLRARMTAAEFAAATARAPMR